MDGMKLYAFGSGSKQTARAIAKIGQLVLNEGQWNGEQIIDPKALEAITSYEGSNPGRTANPDLPAMGIGWLVNTDGFFNSLPKDAIIGTGNGPQVTLVIPSMNLVMVRIGGPLAESTDELGDKKWALLEESLFSPLIASVNSPQTTDALAANPR